jgi:hypothetical protein
MPKGNAKGSAFERCVCKALSIWWTNGARDDVFWRTAGSGARAKSRSKMGQRTFGQYGDIQAIDPIGQPLIDLTIIELKRGYKHASIADVLDHSKHAAKQPWQKWVEQAMGDMKNADVPYWSLITKRDQREPLIFLPRNLFERLATAGSTVRSCRPIMRLQLEIDDCPVSVVALQLQTFLCSTTPDHIAHALIHHRARQ